MKLNIWEILDTHFRSMCSSKSKLAALMDIFTIFIVPLAAATAAVATIKTVNYSFYGVSISVFAVFAALLLNTQVAIFGIYGRIPKEPTDSKLKKQFNEKLTLRNGLIKELNVNISYLMILSVISLFAFCLFYISEIPESVEVFISSCIYTHFSLTVIIVIKRAHALFSNEYSS